MTGRRRRLWEQMTAAKPSTSDVPAGQPASTEPKEPRLNELQRRRIINEARQAGQSAMANWAAEHLPHSDAPRNIQVVASWLMTLRELHDFHQRVLRGGSSESISGSVELHWGGQVRRKLLEGGSIHHLFNPSELKGSFEDSALVIADAFCDYSSSDEIHEIRGSNWMLLVTVVTHGGSIEQRRYVHKAERGSLKGQLSRELNSLGEVFVRDDQERERRKTRLRERMDAELAIVVADALGHSKSLKRVYDAAYEATFEEKEADVLRELSEGRSWRRRR